MNELRLGEELDFLIADLRDRLAQAEAGSDEAAVLVLDLADLHYDRWMEYGDPADRDAAIRHLTAALGTATGADTPMLEIHAALAELHWQRLANASRGSLAGPNSTSPSGRRMPG